MPAFAELLLVVAPENTTSTLPPVVVIVRVDPATQGPQYWLVVVASGMVVEEEL